MRFWEKTSRRKNYGWSWRAPFMGMGASARSPVAGVDFFTFQRALVERGIPLYTETMLDDDLASLQHLFPT
jgi:hypothetical protein